MTQERKTFALTRPEPEVSMWLSALEDTRQRTLDGLVTFDGELIDEVRVEGASAIGSLLYHVAIVEADWLFDEILGTIEQDWPRELFPSEMREDGQHLSAFGGESLDEHFARLGKVREMLVATISPMSTEELHAVQERSHYNVTIAWVLHHLMQHEAEHRSQIGSVREALER